MPITVSMLPPPSAEAPAPPPARLPRAPTDEERLLYTEANSRLLSLTQLLAWSGACLSLLLFSLQDPAWLWPFTAWVGLGVVYFGLSYLANTTFHRFDLAGHDRLVADLRAGGPFPSVDVFLPSCGEAIEVIENAFGHVARLDYPGRISVLSLDDGGRPEVAALAGRHGFRYLSRPNRGWFKKAGNLRYGYERSDGDFIAIFDADFCPRADFLSETVPRALADPRVGIVQTPQYFTAHPDRNWLENGAASVQEFFYRWVLPGRNRRRSPICVGTNALYRRAALETTGGGALVHNSEDVHTGFNLMCMGYRTEYLPLVLAQGLCPDSLQTFFNQQHRWCSGSMSLLFSRKFWHGPIGLRPRLTFLSGMAYYLYTGLAVLVVPIPPLVMIWAYPDQVFWWNYLLLVPAVLQGYVFLPLWHRSPYGPNAMRTKMVYAWAHLFAFADRLRRRPLSWSPSGNSTTGRSRRLTLVLALLVGWPLLTLAVALAGTARAGGLASPHFLPVLLFEAVFAAVAMSVLQPLRARPSAAAAPAAARILSHGTAALAGVLLAQQEAQRTRH